MKTLLRDIIAQIPGLRFWVARWVFLGPGHNTHRFWGVFPTLAKARAYVPRNFNQGFDAPNLSDDIDEKIPERDLHVVGLLAGLIPHAKNLFDLGGNIGMCFYQYRSQIPYAKDFRWTVSDVPFVNQAGRRIAEKRGETQLVFTDNRKDASGADIYLTAGALQYFENSLADLLRELKDKPEHVLVNRIPLTDLDSFFTLQHMGYSIVPYHISNVTDFVCAVEDLGYELVDHWKNDRFCDIILRPDRFVSNYHGFYFKLGGR